jgi:hypothetical protein
MKPGGSSWRDTVGPRSALAMRGWTPGITGAATASTKAECTSPIAAPNHQV